MFFSFFVVWFFGPCFGFVSAKEQFLRFTSTLPINAQHLYYESPGPISPIEIDATVSQQVRLRILDLLNDFPELKLHCHVAPLDSDSELTSAYLCQKKSLSSPEQCIDPKGQTPLFDAVRFTAIGNRSHGYTFHSQLPVGTTLLDAFYFCRFRNKRGELTSNMVELQDVFYYQKKMVSREVDPSPKILPPLSAAELPLQLECGRPGRIEQRLPSWADYGFPSPFRWSFCDFTNSDKGSTYNCLSKVREAPIRISEYFEHFVFPNGTLILYKRTLAAWKNMGLLCWSHIKPTSIFSIYFGGSGQTVEPIVYDSSISYPSGLGVQPLSSTFQTITIRKGPNNGVLLLASYRADMASIIAEWTKDGERLPLGFPEPTAFMLNFPDFVHDNHSGLYELHIRGQRPSTTFKYAVTVVGPPEVIRPPPPFLLVMEGTDAIFSCEMIQFHSTSLKINGEEFFPNSARTTNRLIEQFPYLAGAVIHPLDINGSRLEYRATNLAFTPGSIFGPTHTVTIVGANNFGYAIVSTFIRVLPRPRIIDSPANYPCGPPCLSSTSHAFDCKLDLSPYRMAHVKQTWDWNGTDVSTMRHQNDDRAIYLEEVNTRLRLLPVLDRQHASLFANSRAVCRLRIYYPAVLTEASSGSGELAFINPKWIVYDSRSDAAVQSALTTEVKLLPDTTSNPASASISWIAAVIIAILIILVIGALTACLVMRNRGETYLLDKEERALGNDPEKELRENEAFRTYERAEEPPLHGSRCSLNDDSAEIGSDADGELDDYNLDPGKFNEEGSFIDQYATETHYKGTLRLPVLSRPYDPLV